MKLFTFSAIFLFLSCITVVTGQTPFVMSTGNYSETFTNIANTTNWPNSFNGTDSEEWGSVAINASGSIGDGVRITTATSSFVTGTSGGVQRGSQNIQLLSTSTANSCAIDLFLDFTGRDAGTISFDVATVFNSTGNRQSKLLLFYSTNGTTFTELTGTNLPYTATNNVAGSASIANISLPEALNNISTVRIRFYEHSTSTGSNSQPKISIDNISVTSTSLSSVADPAAFTATPSSATQINLSATSSNNILVAWNSTNTFGTPTNGSNYNIGDIVGGNGTVLYIGSAASLTNHTGLNANTQYFYKAWSYDGSEYSSGVSANATTSKIEPTNQPTSFAKGTVTTSNIPLTWIAAVAGSQAPDGYLIKLNTGTVEDPIDGTDPANLTAITSGAANSKSAGTSYNSFTGFTAGTMYNFKIYSYTNSGTLINFKTDTPPTLSVATLPNAVTGASLVAESSTSATISWTAASGYNASNHSTLVFIKATSAVTVGTPTNAPSTYTANTAFSHGTAYQGDAAAYCVYNGDGTTVTVTGLNPNTTYHVMIRTVVDASNSDATNSYSASEVASGNTSGLGAPTATSASMIGTTSFTANWGSVNGAGSYRLDVANSNEFDVTQNIASESFENSVTLFLRSGGAFYTGNSGGGDRPASSPFAILGTHSVGISSGSLTLTSSDINTSGHTGVELSFRLAAFSISSTGNGMEVGDIVTVEVSPDGGSTYFNTLRVLGNTNARWAYSATGTATTSYDGNPSSVDFQPDGGGERTTDGYSTVKLTNLPIVSNLRVRITAVNNDGAERWVIDDFKLTGNVTNAISGYNNLTVDGLSQAVTGLTPGSTYYYRVRGFSDNSTSGNSNVISVTTANNSQSTTVSGTGSQNVTVSGTTGVGGIQFTNVTTPGDILVSRFNNTPADHGLTGSVSNYRWIIEPGNSLVINQVEGYQLRFNIADCPGIAELTDGDNTTIKLYKRSTPGSGAFTVPIALTYNRNGSSGNQSDDYLLSALITDGFSEFVFNSPSEPLPVELSAFSASTTHNSVTLNWETKTEINNYGFEIERTTESGTWAKIAFVAGNGNSNSPKRYSYTDKSVTAGKYQYRLKQIDSDGQFEYSKAIEADLGKVTSYALEQNYPNPFNPTTVIRFSLVENSSVRLDVYSSIGELVHTLANQTYEAGNHAINFDASQLSAGIYLYRITAIDATGKTFSAVKKMQLIK